MTCDGKTSRTRCGQWRHGSANRDGREFGRLTPPLRRFADASFNTSRCRSVCRIKTYKIFQQASGYTMAALALSAWPATMLQIWRRKRMARSPTHDQAARRRDMSNDIRATLASMAIGSVSSSGQYHRGDVAHSNVPAEECDYILHHLRPAIQRSVESVQSAIRL